MSQSEFAAGGHNDVLKRCALTLYAVPIEDREWLLSQLSGSQVPELERLIGELESIGIVADPRVARDAIKQSRRQRRAPPGRRIGDAEAKSGPPPRPEQLARLLQHEPEGLVARVVELHGDGLLAHLEAEKRGRVQELAKSRHGTPLDDEAPRLASALRQEIFARAALPSGMAEKPGARSVFAPLKSGWSRLAGFFL